MKAISLILLILVISVLAVMLLWYLCKGVLILILLGCLFGAFFNVFPAKYKAPKWRKR